MNLWYHPLLSTHPITFCVGSKVLEYCSHDSLLVDAWSPLLTSLTSILTALMSHLPQSYYSPNSHAPGLFILFNMASSGIFPYLHAPFVNVMLPSRSVYSPENTLLAVISGVDEGIVQGIPW